MHNPSRPKPPRRRFLQAAAAAAAAASALVLPRAGRADIPISVGARLSADFDPVAAMWLGFDEGHAAFTADLFDALWPHVPIKMLVRDADAEIKARALFRYRGHDPDQVQFVQDARAPYFVRDGAVFGLDGKNRKFIVDFQWTYYGWTNWCRRTFVGNGMQATNCARTADHETGALDQRFARALGLALFRSPLAIEGGGVEVNGQGLLIANTSLWSGRNRGMSRDAIEQEIRRLPGIRKVIWLPSGLAQDPLHRATITGSYVGWGTGGHTDEFVRFADARTVLLAWADETEARQHPVARLNQRRMEINFDILSGSTDQNGKPLRVIKVPLPRTIERPVVLSAGADTAYSTQWTAASFPLREGRREGATVQQVATSSYLNHVLANGLVLLPDYVAHGTPAQRQDQVCEIYQSVFPGRKIQLINAVNANWTGGGAHCATLSEPAVPA